MTGLQRTENGSAILSFCSVFNAQSYLACDHFTVVLVQGGIVFP
jgi:hypothetical protein